MNRAREGVTHSYAYLNATRLYIDPLTQTRPVPVRGGPTGLF
jgi:hypothetical protein